MLVLIAWDLLNLAELPLFVTKRAHRSGLEPSLNAVEMEDVPAGAKGDGQAILRVRRRVGLVFNRRLVERIAANGTGVSANVPGPHSDRIPLCETRIEHGRRRQMSRRREKRVRNPYTRPQHR